MTFLLPILLIKQIFPLTECRSITKKQRMKMVPGVCVRENPYWIIRKPQQGVLKLRLLQAQLAELDYCAVTHRPLSFAKYSSSTKIFKMLFTHFLPFLPLSLLPRPLPYLHPAPTATAPPSPIPPASSGVVVRQEAAKAWLGFVCAACLLPNGVDSSHVSQC